MKIGNYELTENQFYGREKYQGDLYLRSLTAIPEGFNPTVGGYLNLPSLTAIPDGFNPTVGGNLDLSSLTAIPEGFKPRKLGIYSWQNGKYILCDSIFTEVLQKRGNVYKIKKITTDKTFYLVTDGAGRHAHGDTIKAAKADLIYKLAEDIDLSKFKGLTLESALSFEQCIELYRSVTRACALGCKLFIDSNGIAHKDYTIAEVLEITEGQYGHDSLVGFFFNS